MRGRGLEPHWRPVKLLIYLRMGQRTTARDRLRPSLIVTAGNDLRGSSRDPASVFESAQADPARRLAVFLNLESQLLRSHGAGGLHACGRIGVPCSLIGSWSRGSGSAAAHVILGAAAAGSRRRSLSRPPARTRNTRAGWQAPWQVERREERIVHSMSIIFRRDSARGPRSPASTSSDSA